MVEVPVKMYVTNLLKQAREASRACATLPTATKNRLLVAMAERLEEDPETVLAANLQDVETVGKKLEGETNKDTIKQVVLRVRITAEAVQGLAAMLRRVAALPDPVGEMTELAVQPNGLTVSRMRMPLGVLAIVSDLGPVTSLEMAALGLKAGNAVVLREATEWVNSNKAIVGTLIEVAESAGLPKGALILVERPEREAALELVRQPRMVDAVVPRGSPALRRAIQEQAKNPVLCHDTGVSYVYIDERADLPLAQNIVVNSKLQQPAATNAADTVLVHNNIGRSLLPGLARRLLDEFRTEVRGCKLTYALVGAPEMSGYLHLQEASEEDWGRQFLGKTMVVKIVASLDEALGHMARYGPVHTATIVTRDYPTAMRFAREVDAGAVLVNASTRYHDGLELGLGGELGFGTGRLHARGVLGLQELTCEKHVAFGNGQLRQPHPVPVAYEDAIMLKRPS